MAWSVGEVGQLLKLAEDGALSPAELARAEQVGALVPSPAAWRRAADRLLAFGGMLLLAAAVVFFFAYNWADLHRFWKLGMAALALTACTGAALFAAPAGSTYRATLMGACICTGVLLALVGQIYQTGADVWELFAAWALLMLPFVLLARSSASWALWLAVANLALGRALSQSAWSGWLGAHFARDSMLLVAAANLAVLVLFEARGERLLAVPRRHLQRLAALGMLMPLAIGGMMGWWEDEFVPVTGAFLLVAGGAAWFYLKWRRDLVILALALFGAIPVFTSALVRALPKESDFFALNLVALFVIGSSALAGKWLVGLSREGRGE
ncbi:MAG TPA: DUF2157 domain-containing protein [Gammaproteobacteria bacterium]|nr:DUF2157 domain-containing protein [Gammaproteobacteria bacterium]